MSKIRVSINERRTRFAMRPNGLLARLTWIEEEQKFETSVIDCIELELGQFHCELVQFISGRANAEQGQSEQIKALTIG